MYSKSVSLGRGGGADEAEEGSEVDIMLRIGWVVRNGEMSCGRDGLKRRLLGRMEVDNRIYMLYKARGSEKEGRDQYLYVCGVLALSLNNQQLGLGLLTRPKATDNGLFGIRLAGDE